MVDGVVCPHCGGILTKDEVQDNYSCCLYCGDIINLYYEGRRQDMHCNNMYDRHGWSWDDDDDSYLGYENSRPFQQTFLPEPKKKTTIERKERKVVQEEDIIKTFVIRVLCPWDLTVIHSELEALQGDVSLIETPYGNDTILTDIMTSSDGEKLAKSYKVKTSDLNEYKIEVQFIIGSENEKLQTISRIFKTFDFCIIREESSTFIMCSNKGLAKGLLSECDDSTTKALAKFITAYEKYLTFVSWADYCGPSDVVDAKADDIMIMGPNQTLLPFSALIGKGTLPEGFLDFLISEDSIKLSTGKDDSGDYYYFEEMLEEVHDSLGEEVDTITICSVRGCDEFLPADNNKKEDVINANDDDREPTY